MEQWEYLTTFMYAQLDKAGVREFLRQAFPRANAQGWAENTPRALIPELNEYGRDGWELVHMEPVARVTQKGAVLFPGGGSTEYSNAYFCVFKRRTAPPSGGR